MAKIQPQKSETHSTRLTVGEAIINLPGDVITPTEDIKPAKLIFNSFLSAKIQNSSPFILEQFHGQMWIYETATGNYPRWNYLTVKTTRLGTQRLYVYVNSKIHIWTAPSRQYL